MARTPSIRVLVTTLGVAPILLLAVTLLTLLGVSTRAISERLGITLVDNATAEVRTDVTAFLASAVRVSDLYERRVRAGILPTSGLRAWERAQLDDLAVNPGIASISFGAADGETTWVLRRHQHIELGRVQTSGRATEHVFDPDTGAIGQTPLREYSYDPRQRPWYKAAIDAGKPVWTPVYFWFGDAGVDSETGAGYARPIRRADGSLAGVLVIDVTLGGLSTFLAGLNFADTGSLFIVDADNRLVAASHGSVNSVAGERLSLAGSEHPMARAVAAALESDPSPRDAERTLHVSVKNDPARVRVTPLHAFPGIDWRIIAVIPEAAFLADARSLQRRAFLISIVTAVGGVLLAWFLASHLTRPLLALVSHVRRVGAGDFASRLELRSARELQDLSSELNRMASQLRTHLELEKSLAVATQVQQDLLPAGPPNVAGLDIAGHSRYCDATGGDYYDFIDVSDLPDGRLLVAVGDVMGHGIAAALLMATARAALRAHAWRGGSLGELLDRVNTVLSRESRHGRFMTMVLVIVDPVESTIRWASAGHDPPLIFEPHADRFLDIEGGDLPLGVVEDTHYEEYTITGLEPGSVIVVGTDGIWEAVDRHGQMFGKDRLRTIVRAAPRATPSADLVERIQADLSAFCGEIRPQDDITLVVMRLEAIPTAPAPPSPAIAIVRTTITPEPADTPL